MKNNLLDVLAWFVLKGPDMISIIFFICVICYGFYEGVTMLFLAPLKLLACFVGAFILMGLMFGLFFMVEMVKTVVYKIQIWADSRVHKK